MPKRKDPQTPQAPQGRVEPVKRKVSPGACPKGHYNTRVYNTKGPTRYCVCDDCGESWKVLAERADPDRQWLAELADALEQAVPVAAGEGQVICLEVGFRAQVVRRLREIAG